MSLPPGVNLNIKKKRPFRRLPVFGIISLTLMMMSIDATIVSTALHSIQKDLGASIHWISWTITAYSLGFVLMLPVSGKLSDVFGRRRIFLISVLSFMFASWACGVSNSVSVLVISRFLQGAGGAGFTPSATGIVVDHFGKERDRAVGLFGTIFPIGAMIGPVVGGVFVTYLGWRSVFWVNIPICFLIIVGSLYFLPEDLKRADEKEKNLDSLSGFLLGAGIFLGMLFLSLLGEGRSGVHIESSWFLGGLGASVVFMGLFFIRIQKVQAPFIPPHLILGKGFGSVNLANATLGGIPLGIMSLIPIYATYRYGIGIFEASSLLIAQGLASAILSVFCSFIIRRTGYRLPIYTGGALTILGIYLLSLNPLVSGLSPQLWLMGSAFLVGAGKGILNPATRNAGLQLAPQSASTLAALRSMSLQIGAILAVTILSVAFSGVDRPGEVLASYLRYFSYILIFCLVLVPSIPEHKGAW